MKDGLLLVDKPKGCTSHDVVASCRRILRQRKIGHCGTLDPDATGLLLLTVGRATRLTRFLIKAPKVYTGTARFGITTDTYDLQGTVVAEGDTSEVTTERIREGMDSFVGAHLQAPPPYCAKKVGGVKYYELAREGKEVPDKKKEVTIFELESDAEWTPGEDFPFLLSCTSGTYARSVVHDLGQMLGCGGTLASLRRTVIGSFRLEDALDLEALKEKQEAEEDLGSAWVPFDDIPLPFGVITSDSQQERRIQHGQTILVRDLEGAEGDWIKIMSPDHRLIAVGSITERIGTGQVGVIQPKVVFS